MPKTLLPPPSPRHFNTWLFDDQDHALIKLVNYFVQTRLKGEGMPLLDSGLHPHGIAEMTTSHGLRMARALITLLDSLQSGGMQERLQALHRLHDEVLNTAHAPLRYNTARVLIQLMKELVRACPEQHRQLPLAHQFHRAVQGNPRIIRTLLARYHLLEMPEEWNQHAFDHHVHDANTKGRKNPTHLVMDAWVKGLRFLTVVYYNTVEEEAAQELLRAAHIMGITVRIGIEFRATFRPGGINAPPSTTHTCQPCLVDIMWSPLHCNDDKRFMALLRKPEIAAVLAEYAPVRQWMHKHVLALLRAWNEKHRHSMARQWEIPTPPPLNEEAFLSFAGQRQPSSLHLAEYIHRQCLPLLRAKMTTLRHSQLNNNTAKTNEQVRHLNMAQALENLTPDDLRTQWLGPEANTDIVFPLYPHSQLPAVWHRAPEELLTRLSALHPCQMVLNLADLNAADVLELLWRSQGRITHLELFNLREWTRGRLKHVEKINVLQRALNEGSAPRLKQVISQIVAELTPDDARQNLFREIQLNIPILQEYYALAPLGSRIGTDSTSHSHRTHGMGLVFTETLPRQARYAHRLTLPVSTSIYSFEQHHQSKTQAGPLTLFLRRIPGFSHFSCHTVRGWALEKTTTRVGEQGNLVTLGGVNALGLNNDLESSQGKAEEPVHGWNIRWWNSSLCNALKVLAGFIPAQWAFYYTAQWWVLALFGPLLWFGITGFRNVVQSVLGGGGLTRSMLLPWKRYISWSRLADSLLFTGFSVPLLDVVVRLWLLEDTLGLTVKNNPWVVYTVIALINSAYISSHNLFRGLPKEAVIGNLFRSALSIPLSMLLGHGLLTFFIFAQLPDPASLLQNCAAIVSKCSSDMVAAVIEGFADRTAYLRRRMWDYEGKLAVVYKNFTSQELLFPRRNLVKMLEDPSLYWEKLYAKDARVAERAIIHMLDMMYFWYYQPMAREVFRRKISEAAPEERAVFLGMLNLLELEREVCQVVLHGMFGGDFGRALAFYLQNHKAYVREVRQAVVPMHAPA